MVLFYILLYFIAVYDFMGQARSWSLGGGLPIHPESEQMGEGVVGRRGVLSDAIPQGKSPSAPAWLRRYTTEHSVWHHDFCLVTRA